MKCFPHLVKPILSTTFLLFLMYMQVIFPNEAVSMMLALTIGIIGPIDMEMLALGQETQKYFTDDYELFTQNEVPSIRVLIRQPMTDLTFNNLDGQLERKICNYSEAI